MNSGKRRLGSLIKTRRKQLGIRTQSDLGKMIGVDQPTIARWETGVHFPSNDYLKTLAQALELPVEKLQAALREPMHVGSSLPGGFDIDEAGPAETIKYLRDQLNKLDAEVGQIQRVVGDIPDVIADALRKVDWSRPGMIDSVLIALDVSAKSETRKNHK